MIKPSQEIDLNNRESIMLDLGGTANIKIEELQLEMSCGFNMLDKQIQITVCGEQKVELPPIVLSQMYKLAINVSSLLPKEKGWNVTHLIIKPCQTVNHPISIGVNTASCLS